MASGTKYGEHPGCRLKLPLLEWVSWRWVGVNKKPESLTDDRRILKGPVLCRAYGSPRDSARRSSRSYPTREAEACVSPRPRFAHDSPVTLLLHRGSSNPKRRRSGSARIPAEALHGELPSARGSRRWY